jgi:hypothetical protein
LALPEDILVYQPVDPEDWMGGDKWSNKGYEFGPFYVRTGMRKSDIKRAEHIAFLKPNPFRDSAVRTHQEIDLENAPIASIVAFLDDEKAIELVMTDYAVMRSASSGGDWRTILHYMHVYPERLLVQLYGLLSFAKSDVPIDTSGILYFEAKEVFDLCLFLLDDPNREIKKTHKLFALYAFHNILCTRAGRMEYFNPEHVKVFNDSRKLKLIRYL